METQRENKHISHLTLNFQDLMHSCLLVPLLASSKVKYCQSKTIQYSPTSSNYFHNKAQNTKPYQHYNKIKKKKIPNAIQLKIQK